MMYSTQTQISFSSLNIESCFRNHYIVPDYQREYVWEHGQVEQLLSDLLEAFQSDSKKDYFLGTIVTYKTDNYFELIDGQQRLTTFYILLCALRKVYMKNQGDAKAVDDLIYSPSWDDDGNTVNSYHLRLQYEEASNYLELIYRDEVAPHDLSASGKKLFDAFDIVQSTFEQSLSDFALFKKFAAFLLKKTRFIQIETYDITDALKIFETINQRGVGLNPMELLKNMIFRQVDREKFKELNMKWKEITSALEGLDEKPLRFLRYFIMSNYDVSSEKAGILREDRIYAWLTENNSQCHYEEHPFEFVAKMKRNVERYSEFLKPKDANNGNQYLKNIVHFAGGSYKFHLLLLLSATNMEAAVLTRFKKIVESVVYYSIVSRIPTNNMEQTFTGWCSEIRKIHTENDLNHFVNEKILPLIDGWKKRYRLNFEALGLNTALKYRVKFILAKITAYVDALVLGQEEAGDLSVYRASSIEIEHIMPKKCEDKSVYGVSEEDFSTYRDMLGNLTLLENTLNKSIQNGSYEEKIVQYRHSKFYLTKSISELVDIGTDTAIIRTNKKLKAWSEWNKSSIEERQQLLYELSEEIWGIHINETT